MNRVYISGLPVVSILLLAFVHIIILQILRKIIIHKSLLQGQANNMIRICPKMIVHW